MQGPFHRSASGVARAALLAALFWTASASPAEAVAVSLVPPYVEKVVRPGRRVGDTISYTNQGSDPVIVTVSVVDFEVGEGNDVLEAPPGTQPATLAPFLRVSPSTARVAPGQQIHFRYAVDAPGEFTHLRAMVYFVTRPELPEGESPQVVFVARLGVPVYVESTAARLPELEVREMAWSRQGDHGDQLALRLAVANQGGRIFRPSGFVEVRSDDGTFRRTYPFNAGREPVLPEHTRRWETRFGPVPGGDLSVRLHLETSPRTRYRTAERVAAAQPAS